MGPSRGKAQTQSMPGGYKRAIYNKFSPDQQKLWDQNINMLDPDSYIARLAAGDPEIMAEMEAPAMRQFAEMQGNMGSRFAGMGQGALKSSGFRNSMNQATSDFAQRLQADRANIRRQAAGDIMNYGNQMLNQKPYGEYMYPKKNKFSWMQALATGALPAAGAAIGGHYGRVQGAKAGYDAGQAFSQGLGGY